MSPGPSLSSGAASAGTSVDVVAAATAGVLSVGADGALSARSGGRGVSAATDNVVALVSGGEADASWAVLIVGKRRQSMSAGVRKRRHTEARVSVFFVFTIDFPVTARPLMES